MADPHGVEIVANGIRWLSEWSGSVVDHPVVMQVVGVVVLVGLVMMGMGALRR